MEPQRFLKVIGKNTEYTQNNEKDLEKIFKARSGFLKIFGKISKDSQRSLKIIKIFSPGMF